MNTNFTLYIAPLAAAAVISAIAAIYTWTRRSTNGAIPLLLMAASITIWSVGYAFEIALPGLAQKYAAGVIQYIGIALAPYAWLWFAISYNELKRFLNRRAILLTAVVPFSTILLAFTTKWHGLIWSEYHLNQEGDFSSLGVSYGVWFFVHSAYSYLILLIGVILLLRALFRKQGMYRGQITALLIAVLAPVAGNVLYLTGNSPIPHLDLTPFAFTISVAALAWAIFGFHLVDVTPLARELVIDFMREGMIVLDGRGNIVDINNAASRMIGTAVADAIGKTARNIFQPWPTLIENAGGTVEAIEEFTVGEGNSQRRYRARFSPLSDSGNNIIGRVIMMRSLDDAQSAIRQAEEQIRKLSRAVEQSANSIIITDTEGHIEYVNPRFVAVTGYSFEEIKGKNPRILKSGRQRPEFYEKLWKTITSGEVWHGVFHNKRKDGSLYWESATIAPVFNDDGIVTNFVAIKEDITTRRQAEEQLRKLSQAVEQSGNTVIIMDSEGVIEYVNPKFTEVTGYSAAEAIGKSTSELMAGVESRRNYREDDWWKTVNAGRTWHGEFHNKRKDGSLFWESATIGPVHDENGVVVNFVEIKQDVTDEKLLQEQLEKQNDYLSVLHQITLDLLNRRETSDLLQAVVDRSAVLLDVPYSELMLVNGNELVVHAATGNMHTIKGERVTREQAKLSWEAFDSRQPVVMEDYSTWAGRRHEYDEYAVHATAEIPILAGDRSLGVLSVGRSQPNYPFTAEQIETGILFAQLTALVLDNVGLYESAMQELAERKRVEAQNEAFLHDIKALQEISLELSETETLKELYVKMIRLAQNRLGLERIGLFVIDAQTNELQGTFGIDQDGNVRDESYYREAMHEGHWTEEIVEAHNHTKLWVDAPIFDNGRAVGHGWKTASALWNGQRAVGYIVADCFVTRRPARPYEAELTSLLGNTFGHLIEIKQNEVRLQESEVRFRQIVENAGDIIYRTDANGNFTYVNPTSLAIMGYQDEKEVLGRNFLELVVPAFRKEMRKFYYRQFLSKTASTYHEFPAFTAQGEVVWFGQNVRLILENDEIVGFQAVARDVTQLRETQEALAISRDQALDASRMKSQLLSRVSHELRTPLGSILGYAELMHEKAFGELNDEQRNAMRQIIASTHFLAQTVNDLLDEAQIEARSLSLKNIAFSPSNLLDKVSANMSVLAGQKNLAFHAEISPDVPDELYGDPHRLQQVLVNLTGNAIKFTKAGEVRIKLARSAPAQWSMEISDTGAGIPASEFERIFEPFRQIDNSITRENRGSGLGLSITKQLIELMGGEVSIQSELGKGTTFTATLPILLPPQNKDSIS